MERSPNTDKLNFLQNVNSSGQYKLIKIVGFSQSKKKN